MKILLPAIGSRGDVQPFISLSQGLLAAGHQVTLATNPTLIELVESYGIPALPVGQPVDMGAAGAEIMDRAGRNWWLGMIRTMQFGFRLVQEAYDDLLRQAGAYDLVITTDTYSGAAEADKLGIPWISVTLQPARVPAPNPRVSPLLKLTFPLINGMIMAPINNFRRKVGAPPVKDMGSMLSQRLILVPVSPHVYAPDPLWPPHAHLTGYWFAQPPRDWTPPIDLLAFLAAGEPPVAVSLGAMSLAGAYTRQAARMTLEAIRRAGVRAVIQGWDEALRGETLPPGVFHAGSLPHSWLFERVRAVVHHGGFGTTASTLRAGLPAAVIPHIIDQTYWGQRVFELGAGTKPIHRASLTVKRLTEALRQVTGDPALRDRAAAVGQGIRSDPDGIQAAVRWIEGVVG